MLHSNDLQKTLNRAVELLFDAGEPFLRGHTTSGTNGPPTLAAISLEVFPWHRCLGLSGRLNEETHGPSRYASADWQGYEFVSSREQEGELPAIAEMIGELWERAEDRGLAQTEVSHLIFIAGARALLDVGPRSLVRCGIVASQTFEFLVLDADEEIRANYCVVVELIDSLPKWRAILDKRR